MSDIVLLRVQRMLFTFLSPQSHIDLSLRKSYLLYQATPSYVGQRVLWSVKPFSFVQVKQVITYGGKVNRGHNKSFQNKTLRCS